MSQPIVKKSQYRQRVYVLPDTSVQLIYGDDPAPINGTLLADHDVTELITVVDHVPVPAGQ
jgi:hypothetical protein